MGLRVFVDVTEYLDRQDDRVRGEEWRAESKMKGDLERVAAVWVCLDSLYWVLPWCLR